MSTVNALVLTGFGLNCDYETTHALKLAGARVSRVHINTLIHGEVQLQDFHLLVFGGGFSWGDDHGAGVIQAVRMKTNIGNQLLKFIEQKKLIIGICNGFQTLVNLGLLPGFNGDYQSRLVALTYNDCGNFRNDWVHLKVDAQSPCVFTQQMDLLEFPIRHGEGKFIAAPDTLARLKENNHIVMRYARSDGTTANGEFPFNPNGSLEDIAGICDTSGRIFGLMPHPEAYNHFTNHPDWTRRKDASKRTQKLIELTDTFGIRLFANGVNYIKHHLD